MYFLESKEKNISSLMVTQPFSMKRMGEGVSHHICKSKMKWNIHKLTSEQITIPVDILGEKEKAKKLSYNCIFRLISQFKEKTAIKQEVSIQKEANESWGPIVDY